MSRLKSTGNPLAAQMLQDARVHKAFEILDDISPELMSEHIKICEIPAPPFMEEARANYFYTRFQEIGLANVSIDAVGNVIGIWPAPGSEYVCLSAHLDTVFPADTDCRVRKAGSRYYAPGISDNVSGLIGLIAIARVIARASLPVKMPILFVATVGEEGVGDLRGVRHLYNEGEYKGRIKYFISFDGPGIERITHRALGSKRYRIAIKGPGGHSWGDFGIVNPVHALGRAIARMADYDAPQQPRTSYNVGNIEGGSSVNTIPQYAEMKVDLRSVSETQLARIEAYLLRVVQESIDEENRRAAITDTTLEAEIELIGHRPSGELPVNSTLVQMAMEATRCFGETPYLECSSTDSNIPISMGLEGITIGAGGNCGSCHTLDEWYEPTDRDKSLKRTLLLMAALAGLS